MKLKNIQFTNDAYTTTSRGEHVKNLNASEKMLLDLVVEVMAVRVEDRTGHATDIYYVPLACIRRWAPMEEPRAVKKAANQ